jgi:hypothetical protein
MNNPKRDILLHLYGETEQENDLRTLLNNEELKAEYTAMSETKFKLDLRKRERPDPAVIDMIMAAARTGGEPIRQVSRTDRGPVSRTSRLKRVLIPALSIAAVLVVGIGISTYVTPFSTNAPLTASSQLDDAVVPPESLYRFVPSRQGGVTQASTSDERLSWDQGNTIPNLNERINRLRPTNDLDWGESAMPLEMLPNSSRPGFQTAGSPKN